MCAHGHGLGGPGSPLLRSEGSRDEVQPIPLAVRVCLLPVLLPVVAPILTAVRLHLVFVLVLVCSRARVRSVPKASLACLLSLPKRTSALS